MKYQLETQVNDWLRENPDLRITDRQFQLAVADSQLTGYAAITIFYEESSDRPAARLPHNSMEDRARAFPVSEIDKKWGEVSHAADDLIRRKPDQSLINSSLDFEPPQCRP